MNVLLITKGLDIGGQSGGAETFGANLAWHLAQEGLAVTLSPFHTYGTPAEKTWTSFLQERGVDVVFASQSTSVTFSASYRRLADLCRAKNIRLVHSHNQVGTLFALWLKTSGVVRHVVRTAHISQEWGQGLIPWLFRQIFSNWLYPWLVDQEVGVSAAIAEQLNSHPGSRLAGKRAYKIYNAIDRQWIEQAPRAWQARQAYAGHDVPFTIGSVGRLIERKGYHYLLDAFAELAKKAPGCRLVLAGDGEQRPALEEKARALGLQSQVAFLGQRADIPAVLESFDLFVLPSLQEGLPTVILESMACAVPVVATDIPGTRELIKDGVNGWLVPPADPAALHAALVKAWQTPALGLELSHKAIEMLGPFSYPSVAKEYYTLYCRLVEDSKEEENKRR